MTPHKEDTVRRLLEAATEAFADQGFAAASVRAITQAAGVNVAAVNYHFKDKAGLYAAVVKRQFDLLTERLGPPPLQQGDLRAWLTQLYSGMAQNSRSDAGQVFHRLMAREEAAPSGVLGAVLAEVVKPRHDELVRMLALEMGLDPMQNRVDVHRLAKSVIDIGKGLFHHQDAMRRVAPVLFESPHWESESIASLVDQASDMVEGTRLRLTSNNKNIH